MRNKKVKEVSLKHGLTCWLPSVMFLSGIVFAHIATAGEKSSSNNSDVVGEKAAHNNIMLERQSAIPPPGPYQSILFVADFIPKPVSIPASNKMQNKMAPAVRVYPALQPDSNVMYPNNTSVPSNKNQFTIPPQWSKQPGYKHGRPAISAPPPIQYRATAPHFNKPVRMPLPPRYSQIPGYGYPPVRMAPPRLQSRQWQQYPQSRPPHMAQDNVERK